MDASQVTVMSFSAMALRRVRLLAPTLPTVLLMDRLPVARRDGTLPTGVRTAGPGVHLLRQRPEYVRRARAHGHRLYVWTVDAPEDVEMVLSLGVDGIITNRPHEVLARLGR
jgi:glycerophosphoryl diester phosphodiesterase